VKGKNTKKRQNKREKGTRTGTITYIGGVCCRDKVKWV